MSKNLIMHLNLFNNIPDQGREDLLRISESRQSHYEKDRVVALMGDNYNDLIIVCSGSLVAEMIDGEGHIIKVETLRAPSAVASGILFADENYLPVQLRAEVSSSVCRISKQQLLSLCAKYPALLENLLRDSGNKIAFLAAKIQLFKFKKLNQKIAAFLMNLAKRQNSDAVKLPYSIEGLSELFGVSRPSLSRSLSDMVKSGLLSRKERMLVIEDKNALRDLLL